MTVNAPPPYPAPPADPNVLPRLLAGMLAVLAAGLVLAGSFLPQTSYEETFQGHLETKQSMTTWTRHLESPLSSDLSQYYANTHVARYGIPLTAATLVLLAGAVMAFAAARRTAGDGLRSSSRSALLVGGTGAATAVWMLGMDVSSTLSYEQRTSDLTTHYAIGTGFWVLIGAGVVSVVTAGLALLAGRRPRPAGPFSLPSQPFPAPESTGRHHAPSPEPFPSQLFPSQPFPSQPFPAQAFPAQPSNPTEPTYRLPPLDAGDAEPGDT